MFFGQLMRGSLQLFEIGARLFQHLLFDGASRFLFVQHLLIAFLLRAGAVAFLPEPFQLQARHRQSRRGASKLLGHLAMFVIERERFFFLLLLQPAQRFQIFTQHRDLAFQLVEPRSSLVDGLVFGLNLAVNSRNSRLSARGPLPVFLPPLTAWP